MRQPLEDGQLTLSRAAASLTYPARCTLVAAMKTQQTARLSVGVRADNYHLKIKRLMCSLSA
jgi:predicted ATPase with chaperone activity